MAATEKNWLDGNPPQCNAVDLNGFKDENNNLIASTDVALNTLDNNQTTQAVSAYAAGGDFYVDSGAVNAYVLSTLGSKLAPTSYFDGMKSAFLPQNTNTSNATVNVASLGVVDILLPDGTQVSPGDIKAGIYTAMYFDGSDFRLIDNTIVNSVNPNLIIGGNFSRNTFPENPFGSPKLALTFTEDLIADNFVLNSPSGVTGSNVDAAALASDMPFELFNVQSDLMLELTNQAAIASMPVDELGFVSTAIEGTNWANLFRKPFTVQLGVKSSVTGVYSVFFQSKDASLNYGTSFTINSSNTWESKTITIPGNPNLGTWDFDSEVGLRILIVLASGTNFHGTQDTWQVPSTVVSASQVNWLENAANTFTFGVMKLESGSIATNIEDSVFTTDTLERYYQKSYDLSEAPGKVSALSTPVRFDSTQISPLFTDSQDYRVRIRGVSGGIPVRIYNPVTGALNSVRNTTLTTNVDVTPPVLSSETTFHFEIAAGVAVGEEVTYHWVADATMI